MEPKVINHKFAPLWESNSRYFVITGGRGSAKSFAVQSFLATLSFQKKHRILVTRYTMATASLSVIPEFAEKINFMNAGRFFKVTRGEIINQKTNSMIIFRGIRTQSGNQTASLKSLTGITTWVLDEAEELDNEDTFDKIDESVRVKGVHNRIVIILNPATKEHWIYKRFFEEAGVEPGSNLTKGDVTYIHTTYLDNIDNISESIIRKYESLKISNPKKYQHRVLGGWIERAEGVVFENWKYGKFDESLTYCYGMDWGFFPDPTVMVKVALDRKKKKIYAKLIFHETELSENQIFELVKEEIGFTNSLIIADNSENRIIVSLHQKTINIRPVEKKAGFMTRNTNLGFVLDGIRWMQDYEIIVDEGSSKIGAELNNYCWSDKKKSTPIDDWNHCIDAIRYALQGLTKPQRRFIAV